MKKKIKNLDIFNKHQTIFFKFDRNIQIAKKCKYAYKLDKPKIQISKLLLIFSTAFRNFYRYIIENEDHEEWGEHNKKNIIFQCSGIMIMQSTHIEKKPRYIAFTCLYSFHKKSRAIWTLTSSCRLKYSQSHDFSISCQLECNIFLFIYSHVDCSRNIITRLRVENQKKNSSYLAN